MADHTRQKDLNAKLDLILSTMDQREERLLMAMDQRDEKVKQLEQSLLNFTKYFENQQNKSVTSTSALPHPLQYELISENKQKGTKIYHTISINVDFPWFEGIDVLNWIFKAE